MAINAVSDMLRRRTSPARSQRKVVRKDQLPCWRSLYTWVVCSQDSHPRKSILRKKRKIGITSRRQILQRHVAPEKNRERKGPSRGIIQKCEPHERSPCAPRFEERSQEETLHQERRARRAAWDLAKNIDKLKNAEKATFDILLLKQR